MEKKKREREKAPVQIRTPEINVEMEGNLGFCHVVPCVEGTDWSLQLAPP